MKSLPIHRARLRRIGIVLGLMALCLFGAGIRRYVYVQQTPQYGPGLPFTLESALQFRYIRMLYTGEPLPAVDRDIEYPGGIHTFQNDTVGSEYVYAALAHLFPSTVVLADRVRILQLAWFSVGIGLLAVWVRRRTGSWAGAWAAGALYAATLGSVIRSTGQEISHENFALPFWLAHLCLAAAPPGAAESSRMRWLRAWGSGLMLALALTSWDMIQLYVACWMAARAVAFLRAPRGAGIPDGWWVDTAPVLAALAVVGLAHPYFRAHGFLASPIMAVGWGMAIAGVGLNRGLTARSARVVMLVIAGLVLLAGASYIQSYGHFADLLRAKIIHWNHKPADPALLNFNQRIMWVPALHSANVFIVLNLFPYLGPLAALASLAALVGAARGDARARALLPWIGAAALSGLGFILFVRFCVFTAVLSAAVCGAALAWAWDSRRRWIRTAIAGVMGIAVLMEFGHVLRGVNLWGPSEAYYPQLRDLGAYLRDHVAPEPVAANFYTSGFILAYGHCPVILHPKFESPGIRTRVEDYARALFLGTEDSFRDWAESQGARYYVHGIGEFASRGVECQTRYFINALDPPHDAAVRLFEFAPDRLRLFHLVWGNEKYRVFRITYHADEQEAARLTAEAAKALKENHAAEAEALAARALGLHPRYAPARALLAEAALRRADAGLPEAQP